MHYVFIGKDWLKNVPKTLLLFLLKKIKGAIEPS